MSVERYTERTPTSQKLHERASSILPTGSTRSPLFMWPYPTYMTRAKGCRLWDADGNEYIDYVCNMGPLILGHNHPKVLAAVKRQLKTGFWTGGTSELETRLAEEITESYPIAEQVIFFPSGTEACMNAVRAVRAVTGKNKIIALEGSYHGTGDSLYSCTGIPEAFQAMVTRVPFNNLDRLERKVRALKDQLAAVFIEPILGRAGSLPPREGYLKGVREITKDHDVLLVFDEIVTGFRLARGGASELFGVEPDLAIFGKVIGGGFACAALAGIREAMDVFSYPPAKNGLEVINPRIPHPGTFNDHKIAMAAGLATLSELRPNVYEHLGSVGKRMRDGLQHLCQDVGIRAEITGIASIFHTHFTDTEIVDMDSAKLANPLLIRNYDLNMSNRGINLAKAHASFCSAPLSAADLNKTLKAAKDTLTTMRPLIKRVAPNLIV
jgi:glutamate-1-semialdehyde 2,1-aminomutase